MKVNVWRDVEIPDDAIEPRETEHYTLAEAEDLISALVDHVDAQLVMALSCFLGLSPYELNALRWEDFDDVYVNIRRGVVRGIVGPTKNKWRAQPVPLVDQVRVPLELWRRKSGNPSEGWVFPSRNDTPADLHNLVARVIRPHVEGIERCVLCDRIPKKSGVRWKGIQAGRRCAATAIIENTGGNFAVAQAVLRHKRMDTTVRFYKKAITDKALLAGMKQFELAATNASIAKIPAPQSTTKATAIAPRASNERVPDNLRNALEKERVKHLTEFYRVHGMTTIAAKRRAQRVVEKERGD